jgi:hypothetical protein
MDREREVRELKDNEMLIAPLRGMEYIPDNCDNCMFSIMLSYVPTQLFCCCSYKSSDKSYSIDGMPLDDTKKRRHPDCPLKLVVDGEIRAIPEGVEFKFDDRVRVSTLDRDGLIWCKSLMDDPDPGDQEYWVIFPDGDYSSFPARQLTKITEDE